MVGELEQFDFELREPALGEQAADRLLEVAGIRISGQQQRRAAVLEEQGDARPIGNAAVATERSSSTAVEVAAQTVGELGDRVTG